MIAMAPKLPVVVPSKGAESRFMPLPIAPKKMVFEEPTPISRKYQEMERKLMEPQIVRNKRHPAAMARLAKNISDTLDGFALIEAAGCTDPRNVTEADISNGGFRRVNKGDIRHFEQLMFLVADDNLLEFGQLGDFKNLQELQLRCNQVSTLASPGGSFPSLMTLDVSFNQVDPHTLPLLGSLKNLRTLNLSSNSITELTNGMNVLGNITTLILEGNHLSENAVAKLALMPNLQNLDLASNRLTCFRPYKFLCLHNLNLASNNIEDQEDIAACGTIASLRRLVVWNNPLADGFHPGMPTSSILPGRSDVHVVAVDPITCPPLSYRAHGPSAARQQQAQRDAAAGLQMQPHRQHTNNADAARRLREFLDLSSTPEPGDEKVGLPQRAFKGPMGNFAGSTKPLLNRGPSNAKDIFSNLRLSLISKSTGRFNGCPDPRSWRTTKATEAKRQAKRDESWSEITGMKF